MAAAHRSKVHVAVECSGVRNVVPVARTDRQRRTLRSASPRELIRRRTQALPWRPAVLRLNHRHA